MKCSVRVPLYRPRQTHTHTHKAANSKSTRNQPASQRTRTVSTPASSSLASISGELDAGPTAMRRRWTARRWGWSKPACPIRWCSTVEVGGRQEPSSKNIGSGCGRGGGGVDGMGCWDGTMGCWDITIGWLTCRHDLGPAPLMPLVRRAPFDPVLEPVHSRCRPCVDRQRPAAREPANSRRPHGLRAGRNRCGC